MRDERTKPYLLTLFCYFVLGCMILTANTVMKPILEMTHWKDSQGAMLITCLSMGNLVMSVLGNLVMEKIGRRRTLMLYSCVQIVSFTLFATLPLPQTYYALMFVAGLAWGGINSLVNTVVSEMYDGSAAKLNVMHASYAVGAVLFPILMGFLTMAGVSWRVPVVLVVVLAALQLAGTMLIPLPERKVIHAADGTQVTVAFWKELGFYLAVFTFFAYVGVESSASSWLSVYLSQNNAFFAEHVPAETMVSLMWGTMLVGRLLFAALGAKLDKRILLIVLTVGYLLGMAGIVAFASSTIPAILSVAVMGLSMSAIYATAVANASRYVNGSAVAPGIIFGAGGLGSAVVPLIAGVVSDWAGLRWGMVSLCVVLALLVGCVALHLTTHYDEAK